LPIVTCTADLRLLARRRLPRAMFEFIDTGAYDELTFKANTDDFRKIRLRQRVLVGVDNRSTATTMLGQQAALPVAISSVGLTGFLTPGGLGEVHAACAARDAQVPFLLSTWSVASMEEVYAATKTPLWFQVYLFRDRGFVEQQLARAKAINTQTIVVTVDAQVPGQRHRDVKNQLAMPPKIGLRNFVEYALRPKWSLQSLFKTKPRFGNLEGVTDAKDVNAVLGWAYQQYDPDLGWDDIAWLRAKWDGKLIVKGILDPEDAKKAVEAGADAISVSNHGGALADSVVSSIRALPAIADAVNGRLDIFLDGGVRTGQDVLKALALGARGCLLGRAHMYGLGALDRAGVSTLLDIIKRELDVTMAITGVRTIDQVGPDLIFHSPDLQSSSTPPVEISGDRSN
jgi:L-lactate dehydrogenase (cytochrome)